VAYFEFFSRPEKIVKITYLLIPKIAIYYIQPCGGIVHPKRALRIWDEYSSQDYCFRLIPIGPA
jgi:hypothetical protein